MANLHVRNVPDGLIRRIRRSADAANRSLSAEVVTLLDEAVRANGARRSQARLLDGIARRRRSRRLGRYGRAAAAVRRDRAR